MIQLIRIDDRLLHGQVAYSWKAALNYEAIVIANDNIVNDEIRKSALKIAVPPGVKLAIRTIEESAKLVNNEKLLNVNVLLICSNPKDVYEVLKLINEKPKINLGGIQSSSDKKMFSRAVYLDKEDIDYLDKINELGYEIDVRQTPSESVQNYRSLRQKFSL